MGSVKLTFSDGSVLKLKENDMLIPITKSPTGEKFASMAPIVELQNHVHNGLIPSLMEVLCFCDFFYLSDNQDIAYGSKTVVKVEVI